MSDSNNEQLQRRVEELEKRVKELEKRLEGSRVRLQSGPDKSDVARPNVRERVSNVELGEHWLNRLGVGLLLLGVLFLFKFSVDQGWLTPPVRSATGLIIGLAVFTTGLRLNDQHYMLKQLLLGGGIATFYITGFATFQLYDFVAPSLVWVFMIVVTLLSLSLSLQQDEAILSVVGVAGGLGTPFMLYGDAASIPALVAYTALVLGGGVAIYWQKGWQTLLWTMVAGSTGVLISAHFNQLINFPDFSEADRWALQAAVLCYLLLLWIIPVARRIIFKTDSPTSNKAVKIEDRQVATVSLLLPVVALAYSISLWNLSIEIWGVIAMAFSLVVGYTYLPLRHYDLPRLASTHGFVGLIFLTISFFLITEGGLLLIILAMEALGLRILADKNRDRILSLSSHVLFAIVLFWVVLRMWSADSTFFNFWEIDSLSNLLVIILTGLAAPYWISDKEAKGIYRLLGHLGFLAWLYVVLVPAANGQAWVTMSWGFYAMVLLLTGFLKTYQGLRLFGMGTIFLVVGKLFLVDLSQLQALWRILLFLGFGVLFLLIGYYLQRDGEKKK